MAFVLTPPPANPHTKLTCPTKPCTKQLGTLDLANFWQPWQDVFVNNLGTRPLLPNHVLILSSLLKIPPWHFWQTIVKVLLKMTPHKVPRFRLEKNTAQGGFHPRIVAWRTALDVNPPLTAFFSRSWGGFQGSFFSQNTLRPTAKIAKRIIRGIFGGDSPLGLVSMVG